MLITHLLGGNFKCLTPHVDLLVDIHTGDDEEDPRPPGSSCQEPAQSEDDGSLVLLGVVRLRLKFCRETLSLSYQFNVLAKNSLMMSILRKKSTKYQFYYRGC